MVIFPVSFLSLYHSPPEKTEIDWFVGTEKIDYFRWRQSQVNGGPARTRTGDLRRILQRACRVRATSYRLDYEPFLVATDVSNGCEI